MLELTSVQRSELWQRLRAAIEEYLQTVSTHRVTPELDAGKIRKALDGLDFARPRNEMEMLDFAVNSLWTYQTHTPHPRYFGLFNPAPSFMSVVGDVLVAAFNPQLAAWSHSPFAVEVEQHLIREFGSRFGWKKEETDGTFASGGAEANHTAVVVSLMRRFPEFSNAGLRALKGQPAVYISAEGHHSILKAARSCGLGSNAVRAVPTNSRLAMDIDALRRALRRDQDSGFIPTLLVATAGTTAAGAIDDLPMLAQIAADHRMWYHVDAAWGGAAALTEKLRNLLDGIQLADSITFDAHKWLSVPMGAGMFLTRHPRILRETFSTSNPYMPNKGTVVDVVDPYSHSMQWSRRFIGFKVFLSLACAGWSGYEKVIDHQTEMGTRLRGKLRESGWTIANDTELPIVCFFDPLVDCELLVKEAWKRGNVWISSAMLGNGQNVLRACITNYRTAEEDVDALVNEANLLREARRLGLPS